MSMKKIRNIKAVVFDMDGTLFDTEKISSGGWVAAGKALHNPMPMEMIDSFRGNNDEGITQKMRTHYTCEEDVQKAWQVRNQYALDQVEQHGVPLKKGLWEAFRDLKAMGLILCMATSSSRERAMNLCRKAGIEQELAFILCGDEITHGKPAPDIFLTASEKLGLPPEVCLVVEDSFHGVHAACAAGCPVVMIPDMDPPDEEIRSLCDAVLDSLDEIAGVLEP